jgi:hypothetical protein
MRILAVFIVAIFCILSVGCTADGVMLQPGQQGEWSSFKGDKYKVSKDVREESATESAEKAPAQK